MNSILRFCAAGIATTCMAVGCYALAVPATMSAKARPFGRAAASGSDLPDARR